MEITNKHNLPVEIVNFMGRNKYSAGGADISVSRLIGAPRRHILRRQHWEDLKGDIAAQIPSLLGTALHRMFEEGSEAEVNHISEERVFVKVKGWVVSGQVDTQIINDNTITIRDYKSTSAWAVMHEKIEWEQQTNLYAYLVEKAKEKVVDKLEIVAIIRDWNRRDAERNPEYPQCMIVTLNPTLWSMQDRERYLLERLDLHATAETNSVIGDDIGKCTPDEQWRKKEKYAVMKAGGVRASKVFDTLEEANAFAADKKDASVVTRPAEATRCLHFCEAAPFCSQWKEENEIF